MKNRNIFLLSFFLITISGCKPREECSQVLSTLLKEMDAGNLSRVRIIADSVKISCKDNEVISYKTDSIKQIADRIAIDFSLDEEQIRDQIKKRTGAFAEEDKLKWEEKGWLEYRLIDGKKMYFRRSVSNMILLKKFYDNKDLWFKENIPWTGALEYSIMADIPDYVLKNMRGDCGMQTFLYISMLRYKGIPVRWQSGWMIPPGGENLHDWCEFYFEGAGWVPSDISYDLQNSYKKEIREYYLSGIDSYRLIVNDGVAGNLYPGKQFMRSEPYDFQRGEVEWKGGNLYFDKWDYNLNIEFFN